MAGRNTLAFAIYFICLWLCIVGLLVHWNGSYLRVDFVMGPGLRRLTGTIAVGLLALTVLAGFRAAQGRWKEFLFANLGLAIAVVLVVGMTEAFFAGRVPPWPASHLHGVDPSVGPEAWGRVQSFFPEAVKNNSWGQRDLERSITKPNGVRRIAFVGDSFLEESSLVPVSLLVDRRLGEGVEVINLGISATHPVDYYDVIANVALELDVDEVVTFVFMGNDFVDHADVRSPQLQALMSPPPRASLLGDWMPGLNFELTRRFKYSTSAWIAADLHAREQAELEAFRGLEPRHMPGALSKFHPRQQRDSCMEELAKRDFTQFHHDLTHPDLGIFRTYVLGPAVCPHYPETAMLSDADREGVRKTVGILRSIQALLDREGVRHRVVLIPLGPEVDRRIQDQWRVLVDFERMFRHLYAKAELFALSLVEASIEVIDLYPILDGQRGVYLSFDGHWSPDGNEAVAAHLAEILGSSAKAR